MQTTVQLNTNCFRSNYTRICRLSEMSNRQLTTLWHCKITASELFQKCLIYFFLSILQIAFVMNHWRFNTLLITQFERLFRFHFDRCRLLSNGIVKLLTLLFSKNSKKRLKWITLVLTAFSRRLLERPNLESDFKIELVN